MNLMWGKEIISKGLRYRVGNERKIHMFKDPWIPRATTYKLLTRGLEAENTLVADYIDEEGIWKVEELEKSMSLEEVNLIRRILTNKRVQDRWTWQFEKSGNYTVWWLQSLFEFYNQRSFPTMQLNGTTLGETIEPRSS